MSHTTTPTDPPRHAAPIGPVVPKVKAQGLTALTLVVLLGAINAITPDLLAPLGAWSPVAFAGVVALGGFIAGWLKSD